MDHDIYKIIFYFPKTLEEFYTFLDPYKMFFIYKDLIKCLNKKEKLCTKLQTPIIDLLKFFKIIFI